MFPQLPSSPRPPPSCGSNAAQRALAPGQRVSEVQDGFEAGGGGESPGAVARPVPLLAPACSSPVPPGLGGQCLSCQGFLPPWPSWPGLLAGYMDGGEGRTGKWVPQRARRGAGGGVEGRRGATPASTPPPPVSGQQLGLAPRPGAPPRQHSVPWGWTLGGEGGMGCFRGLGLGAGGQRSLDEWRGASEPGTWSNLKSWWSPQADSLVGTSGEPPLHFPRTQGQWGGVRGSVTEPGASSGWQGELEAAQGGV